MRATTRSGYLSGPVCTEWYLLWSPWSLHQSWMAWMARGLLVECHRQGVFKFHPRDQEAWVEPSEDLMADNCAMESFSTRTCWVRLCLKPGCGCFHYPWFSTRSLTCDISIHIQHFRVHQPNLTWQRKVILQTQLCQGQLPITLIFEFVRSAGWSKPHMKSLPQTATPHIVWRGCPWIFRLGNNHKYSRPLYWLDW